MHWRLFPNNARQQVGVTTAPCSIVVKKEWDCLKLAPIVGVSGGVLDDSD